MALWANNKVPAVVTKSFDSKYELVDELNWSFQNDQFVASFEHNSFSKISIFEKNGTWVNTITSIPAHELLNCLTEYVNEEYFDPEIIEVEFIENNEHEIYYITIIKSEDVEDCENTETDQEDKENTQINYTTLKFNSNCDFLDEE